MPSSVATIQGMAECLTRLDVRNTPAGVAFVPGAVELLGGSPQLHDEVARRSSGNASSSPAPERALQPRGGSSPGQPRGTGNGRGRGSTKSEAHVILDPAQSAQLRDKLLIEVENIASADLATTWAGEALVAKNSLTATD